VVSKEGKRAAVESLLEKLDLDVGRSFLYSDSFADVPLFEDVGNPVVVNPKAPFRELARRRGWEVVEWRERNRPGAEIDLADEWGSWGG
jgi:phosphoserine phosphatase